MNRGINDSEDLPAWFLSAVYEEIAAEEIKMKTTASQPKLPGQQTERAPTERYTKTENLSNILM